jgi:Ca-activated chloride channel family protein
MVAVLVRRPEVLRSVSGRAAGDAAVRPRWTALVAAMTIGLVVPLGGQRPTFRASIDTVSVDVSVEQRGHPLTNLTADDFEVRDNGVVQQIGTISREALPIDVTFVADLSGSVRGPTLRELTRAIDVIGEKLGSDDRSTLITFNHRIREVGPFPSTPRSFAELIGTPAGQTSLLDALVVSLVAPSDPERRRMAILFTDGLDTSSFEDGPTVVDVARRADAAVFTVALLEGDDAGDRPPDDRLFQTLAEATGGAVAVLRHGADLSASFEDAFEQFRTSYVLRYTYDGTPAPGWHALDVRVKRRGQFEVRARQGYVR